MRCVTTMKQKIGDLTMQLQLVEEHYKSKLVEQAQESQRKWDAQKADLYCEIERLQDKLCSKDRQLNDLKLECSRLRQPVDLDNMQTLKSLEGQALDLRAGESRYLTCIVVDVHLWRLYLTVSSSRRINIF